MKLLPVIKAEQFGQLFLNEVPLMDMRAPLEFKKGAFPGVVTLPLMSDSERQKVGTSYKRDGQEAAIKLGHRLVSGKVKAERMAQWLSFAKQHPDGLLYCFRGGLRSQTVQTWLNEAGVVIPRIDGGYKALRQFLLSELDRLTNTLNCVVLGGHTGSGKTVILPKIDNSIDLEGLANHRGSSFGRQIDPQPSQIDFENNLIIMLMRAEHAGHKTVVFEDESHLIGRCALPLPFFAKIKAAPVVVLDKTKTQREAQIHDEYVTSQLTLFVNRLGKEAGFEAFSEYLLTSLSKIKKRLGDERYQQLDNHLTQALIEQKNSGDVALHYQWISPLLTWYYDPMYSFQIEKKQQNVIFTGSVESVIDFIKELSTSNK